MFSALHSGIVYIWTIFTPSDSKGLGGNLGKSLISCGCRYLEMMANERKWNHVATIVISQISVYENSGASNSSVAVTPPGCCTDIFTLTPRTQTRCVSISASQNPSWSSYPIEWGLCLFVRRTAWLLIGFLHYGNQLSEVHASKSVDPIHFDVRDVCSFKALTQWLSVARPFNFLLFNVFVPFLVLTRDKNPCLRLRTLWLGLYVSLGPFLTWMFAKDGWVDMRGSRSRGGGHGAAIFVIAMADTILLLPWSRDVIDGRRGEITL